MKSFEFGSEYGVLFAKGTLWDGEGNEIPVPEGHAMVCGKESFGFVKMDLPVPAGFVYEPPKEDFPS
jgi:hypothetical protein